MNIKTRIATQCDNIFCGILRVAGYAPTLYTNTSQSNQNMTTTYQADLLSPDTEYNGWTNYETWNVGLWLGGEQMLSMLGSEVTGDGVRWDDPKVNGVEINEMLEDF